MFGRKKRTVKEEVAKELSDKLGVSEEEALKTLNEIQIKTAIFNSKFIDMLATNEKFINALCKNEKLIDALAKKLDFNLTRRFILTTGALGVLTLGMGTAGAKLVLTDKFVELDGQKFYPSAVGAYDAIVLKDDTYVWAEDRFGKVIAEGEAGIEDSKIIQNVINLLSNETGGVIKIKTGTYELYNPIKIPPIYPIYIEGIGLPTFKIKNNTAAIYSATETTDINFVNKYIRNLVIKGDRNSYPDAKGIYFKIIEVQQSPYWIIRDVITENVKTGFYFETLTLSFLENIQVKGNCDNGIFINSVTRKKIFNNVFLHIRTEESVKTGIKIIATKDNPIDLMTDFISGEIGHSEWGIYIKGFTLGSIKWICFRNFNIESNLPSVYESVYINYGNLIVFDRCQIHGGATTKNLRQIYIKDSLVCFRDCNMNAWGANNNNKYAIYCDGDEKKNIVLVIGGYIDHYEKIIEGPARILLKGVYVFIDKNNRTYVSTTNQGIIYITGDGTTQTFTVDITHSLVSDKLTARITLDRDGTVDKVYLVDKDGDGFKETIRVQVTFASPPADNEKVPIYWYAEVVQ